MAFEKSVADVLFMRGELDTTERVIFDKLYCKFDILIVCRAEFSGAEHHSELLLCGELVKL